MPSLRLWAALSGALLPCFAATFGTVVTRPEGFTDLAVDEARRRVYLVNSAAGRVEVYSTNTNPPRLSTSIQTCAQPLSLAMSRAGGSLYVTCHAASTLDVIDLEALTTATRVTLPAKPEGVAVGADERVLISTIGTETGASTLIIYDPQAQASQSLADVITTPPPPTPPQLPAPSGRIFLSNRSALRSTADGEYIVGANGQANNRLVLFVYEVRSATVLRSRNVLNLSNVLAVAPDGSKFMAGPVLFDTQTLAVLAQQNAANAPFTFPTGVASNFNLQQNQGGSIFSPDGSLLYSAFNIAPVQNPPARPNVSRLLVNDPENLLVRLGLQLPENLVGKMVITSDGGTIYALSESGFVVLPVANIYESAIAMPDSPTALLANDQCGVTAPQRSAIVSIQNAGRSGRMSVSAQLLPTTPTGPPGLGGIGGPGGGGPAGPVIIIIPPFIPGAPGAPGGGGAGGAGGGGGAGGDGGFFPMPITTPQPVTGPQQTATVQTAPMVAARPAGSGAELRFSFNTAAARSLGTVPPHDFLIQSPEAINIPPNVRIYQNNRDVEASANLLPVPIGISASEGLVDMVMDAPRQRLYIANSGLNRIEVFDLRTQRFMQPVRVGQLPRSMAMGNDGATLYVVNSGAESISIVDLEKGLTVGRVKFPPLPFNAAFATVTPSVIAPSRRGPQVVMSDGSLWKIVDDTAVPRTLNPAVFGTARTIAGPVRTMASTPAGEFVLLLAGNGTAYLYSSELDDYVVGRQVISAPIQGYFGPIAAGPAGRYYLVNGTVLNEALTPMNSADPVAASRRISAVAPMGQNNYVRFSQPVRANINALPTDPGLFEMLEATTNRVMASTGALEGPISVAVGNARVNIDGRTMAVDPSGAFAYALTSTGLSIIPLATGPPRTRPSISRDGVVSAASYLPSMAPGSLISIFGQNLAASATAGSTPLPILIGGSCVTLNNQPIPLFMTSPGQINAQIPPNVAAGRYPLIVRSAANLNNSGAFPVTVSRFAPAVFCSNSGETAIYHLDGRLVNKDAPAKRDEPLVLYATGLGPTTGGPVLAGMPAPADPLALTDEVKVFFGNPAYQQAEIIVEWSGLVPGLIGLNQINLRVPGFRMRGDSLPVTIRIGGANSSTAGPTAPVVAVD